jgi:phosphatidylserine decarboxylase
VLSLLIVSGQAIGAEDADRKYGSVVEYLEYIVDGDRDLRSALEKNLAVAGSSGPSQAFWAGKTMGDLYSFFGAWLVNPLRPTTSKSGIVDGEIVRHSYLFRNLLNADDALRAHNAFMGWLALFMNARQQFLLTAESAEYVPLWMKDPEVAIEDYIVPEQGFTSFNEFFQRRLKPGARTIADPGDGAVVVSPVDCKVYQLYDVGPDEEVAVKGEHLDFSDLLDGDAEASKFAGGSAFTCNLRVSNYHHFHSPVTGRIVKIGQVGGLYYFDQGFRHLYGHRRAYVIFETEKLGYVALVAVGQVMVNTIRLIVSANDVVEKGQELGHFDFGGSEVVMIFQADRVRLTEDVSPGHSFKLGQRIGVAR